MFVRLPLNSFLKTVIIYSMSDLIEVVEATVKDPTTGEVLKFKGASQEIVDKAIDEYFSAPGE